MGFRVWGLGFGVWNKPKGVRGCNVPRSAYDKAFARSPQTPNPTTQTLIIGFISKLELSDPDIVAVFGTHFFQAG